MEEEFDHLGPLRVRQVRAANPVIFARTGLAGAACAQMLLELPKIVAIGRQRVGRKAALHGKELQERLNLRVHDRWPPSRAARRKVAPRAARSVTQSALRKHAGLALT